MNKQGLNIRNEDSCLSRDEMLDYISGKLNDVQQHHVESHLLDCELCQDAMEGLEQLTSTDKFKVIDARMQEGIDELLEQEEQVKVSVLFPWRMAAAIALIFVSTLVLWLVIPKKNEMELFTQEYKPYPKRIDSIANNTQASSEKQKIEIKNPIEDIALIRQKAKAPEVVAPASKSEVNADEIAQSEPVLETDAKEKVLSVAAGSEEISEMPVEMKQTESTNRQSSTDNDKNSEDAEKYIRKDSEFEAASLAKKSQSPPAAASSVRETTAMPRRDNMLQSGIDAYQSQRYSDAVKFLQKSDDPEALFYLGITHLALENPHLAIKTLDKYLRTNNKKYQEAAWWYTGLSALKTGNRKLAKSALEKVLTFKGEFEQDATDLLRKL